MSKFGQFLKTTLLGGVMVLVPFLLFYMLFSELLDLVIALAFPILEFLPGDILDWFGDPLIPAILILVVCSFLAGLSLQSEKMKTLGNRIEMAVLEKLPMYKAVKRLSHGLLGSGNKQAFTCGIVELTPGVRELVYITEDSGNGMVTVMSPLAPTGLNGPLKILPKERVIRIDASVGEANIAVSEWGVGLQEVLNGKNAD